MSARVTTSNPARPAASGRLGVTTGASGSSRVRRDATASGRGGVSAARGKVVPPRRGEGALRSVRLDRHDAFARSELADVSERRAEELREERPGRLERVPRQRHEELVVLSPAEGKLQRVGAEEPPQLVEAGRDGDR